MGLIAVATATSGVAASIMPGGCTAHSRFKIPIKLSGSTMCSFTKQSGTTELLRKTSLIIWDEIAMTKRQAVEALDRSLRDIMSCDMPFGGKIMLFGGDFRQTDTWFADYLLRIGNGTEEAFEGDYVWLPDDILIHNPAEDHSIDILIDRVFPNLVANCTSASYMRERAILSTRNEHVDATNALMIDRFPGKQKIFYSFDSVDDDPRNTFGDYDLLNYLNVFNCYNAL
ncbi:uncharacterized protein LOC120662887 [Panicum virgatum]|uniref:uncharacterized protein LOC120662887 n=1 Tax=Panicum virgatum TaxID=38727 RepID=UPI0019D5BC27|nr:uncharacterized protein LOC120662887 [Panicum virgatum]